MSGEGIGARVRVHPVIWGAAAAAALVAVVVVLVWFQPQTLLFDQVVDDEFPAAQPEDDAGAADDARAGNDAVAGDAPDPEDGAGAGPASDSTSVKESAGPRALSTGSFASRNRYTVTGTATVFELDDGTRTLRLEDFESTNGPDLFVYLTASDSADSDPDLDADFVDLGVLRGNVGNQNYALPATVDLDRYDTVVIWCRRFSVGFGAADLAVTG